MNWFEGCTSPSDVKTRYRNLALKHHPDRGGVHEIMVSINLAYEAVLKALHGFVDHDPEGNEHTYYYEAARETALREKLYEVLGLKLHNVEVWLVGSWLWVRGDTKPVKDILKAHGLIWHPKRECWYWHGPQWRTRYNGRMSFEDLRSAYGSKSFEMSEENLPR